MPQNKPILARTSAELATALGLPRGDGLDFELRSELNDKIILAVAKRKLTHAELAKAARTSRSRVTAILNRNTHQVSTDLMLRILGLLGYRAKLTLYPVKPAA
jgi:predicted XRE-type DNA-binding protein